MALISLLVALLMPSLKKVKGTAKAVKCQSNLKQIGLGVSMYAHENNDIVPYVVDWRTILLSPVQGNWLGYGGAYYSPTWSELIISYLGGGGVRYKPSSNRAAVGIWICPAWINDPVLNDIDSPPFYHYCINDWVGAVGGGLHQTPVKLSAITQPENSILAADSRGTDIIVYRIQYTYNGLYPIGRAAGYPAPDGRHNGGVHLVYFDGHVGFLKATDPQLQAAAENVKPWILP